MNDERSAPLDEQLLPWLVACDKALAAGTVRQEPPGEPPSDLRQRLADDLACIRLLRQALPPRDGSGDAASPSGLPLRRLGRFEIHRELGHGAFGMVFLATDPQLGREVALKVPRPEGLLTAELRERFVREARAAAGLDHPNVVPVYEAGAEGPLCYIASAYCPGITLAEWLASRSEAVPVRQAAALVATLAGAVHHAHERGVVHRDLKPSNVLLQGKPRNPADPNSTVNQPDGGQVTAGGVPDLIPRITDFGLAKLTTDVSDQWGEGAGVQTQSGALLGTPNYMAPEQARGKNKEVGPAADIHALGAVLYELLTGLPPFRGETVLDTLEQVKNEEPLPFSRLRIRVPRDLETICLKCLRKDPLKRYASAKELADDLQNFLDRRPIVARPIGLLASLWLGCHRPERVRDAGVYAAALGIVLILWNLSGLAYLALGWIPQARPQELILHLTVTIGVVFCPMIMIGLGTIARRIFSLWLGLVFFIFWFAMTQVMILQHVLQFTFDIGGVFTSTEIRLPTWSLLSFMDLIGILLYAVAVLAYYSNRDRMRGSRLDIAPRRGQESEKSP
jgi:hypothetical protein